jgi:membrane protein implicated in regulation of membrane protease activity
MPLDRLVLILVLVIVAGAVTIWLGAVIATSVAVPPAGLILLPAGAVAYIVWRVVSDRLKERRDDRYDGMEGDG